MNKIAYIYLISFCFVIHIVLGQSSNIDIISYDIKANADFNKKLVEITANVKIEKIENVDSFKILLSPLALIKYVKSENTVIETSRKSNDDDTLFITIPELFKEKNILNLTFEYSLPIDSFILSDMVVLRREVRWYPLQYDDIASMNLDIVTSKNYSVFAVGDLAETKSSNDYINYKFNHNGSASYALIIAKSNNFTTTTKNIDSVNVSFYFASTDTVVNNKIINGVCKSFSFYTKYIGHYKHKQLNLVEIADDRMQLVQSLSTLIVVGSPFINYFKLGYNDWPPHEIAHQWFGSGIYINSKTKGRWFLEESVNEYFRALYIQQTFGVDSFKNELETYLANYNYIDKSKEVPIFEIRNVSTQDDGLVIYQKGPLVVNKLKNLMGNESYEKFIKEIYSSYYNKLLTFDEYIKVLSKYDTKGQLANELIKLLSETGYSE